MKKIILASLVLLILIAGFSSISPQETIDMDVLRTEIASTIRAEIYATVRAEIYATAQAEVAAQMQNTPTPATGVVSSGSGTGFWKPTPTYYSYMAELTEQNKNYQLIYQGEDWDVTWTFKNVGPLDWTNEFYLRYYKGEHANEGDVIYLPAVPRGESTSVTLHFPAKDTGGIYNSYWELIDNDGAVILDNIFIAVQVRD